MDSFQDDILVPMPVESMLEYANTCSAHLPQATRGRLFLLMQYEWKQKRKSSMTSAEQLSYLNSSKSSNNFFIPRNGDPKWCTYVAISGEEDYSVFVFSLDTSNAELRASLTQTARIKWELGPLIVSIETQHRPVLVEICDNRKLSIDWEVPNNIYWLPLDEALKIEEQKPPAGTHFRALRPEDAVVVDSVWPHRYPGSLEVIRSTIGINSGIGLFLNETNQLLAWAIKNDNAAIGFLQTIESEKRKGYGLAVMRSLSKQLATNDRLDSLAYIVKVNSPSIELFTKNGFRKFGTCSWIKLKPLSQ